MIECVGLCVYDCLEPKASAGYPLGVSTHTVSSPFEPADSRSMTAHLSDLMPNVSSALQGWRDGGQKKKDLRTMGDKRSWRGS